MDYQRLYSELPKDPIKWTVLDIQIWLRFIGLENLYPKFKQLAIDGSILSSLTQQDLRDQLQVKSGITIKKIMSWITRGLKQYQEYLKNINAGASSIIQDLRQITQKPKLIKTSSMGQQSYSIVNPQLSSFKSNIQDRQNISIKSLGKIVDISQIQPMDQQQSDKKKQFQLIIQQHDGPQTSFFSVKQPGAKIGRHSSNQILILDQSISRFHAQIQFKQNIFYIRDTGSTTGTFIKISQKSQIFNDMILEMGSNQFLAKMYNGSLHFQIIQGPNQGQRYDVTKPKFSIGRKQNNQLNFPDDQHLSNIHATVYYIEGKYYVEDMGTTNGTWRRLSAEGQTSLFSQLADKVIFKIGSSQTYCCKIKTAYISQKSNPNACIICYQNDKDCVYMPCRHNTACIKCSKNLKQCPICRLKIDDFVRIYKA